MDEVKDSGLTDVILLYKGHSTPGLPHDKLDLEGHERNMHVLLTPKHQACRQLKSVMMLCALQVTTPKGSFIEVSLTKFTKAIFDYPAACIYRGMVFYESKNSHELYMPPSDIHNVIPITLICKNTLSMKISYTRSRYRSVDTLVYGRKEFCFSEQALQNQFISSTDSIMVMFYHYTPQGYSTKDLFIHLNISVVTCQGLTLPCPVMSTNAKASASNESGLENYMTLVSQINPAYIGRGVEWWEDF